MAKHKTDILLGLTGTERKALSIFLEQSGNAFKEFPEAQGLSFEIVDGGGVLIHAVAEHDLPLEKERERIALLEEDNEYLQERCDFLREQLRERGGLTDEEHEAIKLTADLTDLYAKHIVANGDTRDPDLAEFISHMHVIQRNIMAQAAARAHPDIYRLLGDVLPVVDAVQFPTTPNSVIKAQFAGREHQAIYTFLLENNGDWKTTGGIAKRPENLSLVEVLFDAGAENA